jgi:hypothetical protein
MALNILRIRPIWSDYVLALALLGALIVFSLGPPPPPVDISDIHILNRVDSLSKPGSNGYAHNTVLMSVLQQRSAAAASLRAAREGGAMQARVIFCSFLAALASLVSKFGGDKLSWQIQSVFLLLIAIIFFYDVQLEDSRNRQFAFDQIVDGGILFLANTNSTDTTWYSLSYGEVDDHFKGAFEIPDRWWRKLRIACQPNPERLVYYFVPWIFAYLFARPTLRRRPGHV